MFFVLSKVFWFFARPLSFLFFLALAAMLAGWLGHRRLARTGLFCAGIGFMLLGFTQFPDWMLHRLETAVPAGELPETVDAIVILGGGLSANREENTGGYNLADAADRLIRGLELKRRFPDARLIYSGGLGTLGEEGLPETDAASAMVHALYGDAVVLEIENQSRNTWQNALYVERILGPAHDRDYLLVTSAYHLPRATGAFRKAGLEMIPVPADYRADRLRFPYLTGKSTIQFLKASLFLKEYIGIAAYSITGRM